MSDDAYKPRNANLLSAIEHFESGGRNILNYRYAENPSLYTAGGHYQITNSTWKDGAKLADVDTDKYPTAISAPYDVQTKVADALVDKYGTKPWSMNMPLMAYLGQKPQQETQPQVMMASAQPQMPSSLMAPTNLLAQQPPMPQLSPQLAQLAQYQRLQSLLQGMQAPAPQITWPGITRTA